MADNKILDKIKKCLALATSANEHEAAAALRQAQKLMEAHDISHDDVLAAGASEHETKAGAAARPAQWECNLANRIAAAFGCELVFLSGMYGCWSFIGIGANPEIASYACKVLLRQAKRARTEYIETQLKRVRKVTTKKIRADLFSTGWAMTATAPLLAWVHTEEEKAVVTAYVEKHYPALTDLKPTDRRPDRPLSERECNDLHAGRVAGRNAQINRGVGGSDAPLSLGDA